MLILQSTTLVEVKQHISVSAYSPKRWKETAHYSDWTRRITSHFLAKITIKKPKSFVNITSHKTELNSILLPTVPIWF